MGKFDPRLTSWAILKLKFYISQGLDSLHVVSVTLFSESVKFMISINQPISVEEGFFCTEEIIDYNLHVTVQGLNL